MRPSTAREALFAIDGKREVVMWAQTAEDLLGMAAAEVLGRPCWQMLRGGDVFGRPLPCDECQACLDSAARVAPPPHHVLLEHREGRHVRLLHELLPLPAGPGARALVLLTEAHTHRSQGPEQADHSPDHSRTFGNIVRALSTLGMVGDHTSSVDFYDNLDSNLDRVLSLTGGEAAEVFLWNRYSGEMCLSAHRGLFPSAFRQMTRFSAGQGYPGLVAASGEPLVTRDLCQDERFLRTKVKQKGVRSYISVPLRSGREVIGCLNLASRRNDADQDCQAQVLSWLAGPVGSAAELAILRSRDRIISIAEELCPSDLPVQALRAMLEVSGADHAAVSLWPMGAGRFYCQATSPETIPCAGQRAGRLCPVRKHGQAMIVSSPASAPAACRESLGGAREAICIPIGSPGKIVGAASFRFRKSQPVPTRSLALLGAMSRIAGRVFAEAAELVDQEDIAPVVAGSTAHWSVRRRDRPDGAAIETVAAPGSSTNPPFLDIRCFGSFQVFKDGKPLSPSSFGRRQSYTLLKMLVTRRGHPVSSDFICEALWPETEPEAASKRLWVIAHALRTALEPGLKPGKAARFVHRNGHAYTFDPQVPYRLDVEDFLRASFRGRKTEAGGDTRGGIEAYEQATRLYLGDFMEEEPYSDWCLAEREYLREVFLDLLGRLAALYAAASDWGRAVACHRRALLVDGVREEVHRELMRCLYRAGRRDEALRQYADCREILARELDVEPLPETLLLYQEILSEENHSKPL